jgi:hypothetical protein
MFCAYIGMCPLYCIYKKNKIHVTWIQSPLKQFVFMIAFTYFDSLLECVQLMVMDVFHVAHDYVHECVVYLYVLV